MFCDNCGQQNPDSARFCTGCGRATDGSAPAPMVFASEVGSRLRGAVEQNQLLTIYMIAFYLGMYSLLALAGGMALGYSALMGGVVSGLLGGMGGGQIILGGIGGVIACLLGIYGLASVLGLFRRQAWARQPAIFASIAFAIAEFSIIFFAGAVTGPILLLVLLKVGIWGSCAYSLSLPSVKATMIGE